MNTTNTKDSPGQGIRMRKLRLFAVLLRKIVLALLPAVLAFGGLGLFHWLEAKMEEPKRCRDNLAMLAKFKADMVESYKDAPDGIARTNAFFEGADFLTCPSTGQKYVLNKIGEAPVCPSGRRGHSLSEIPGRDGGGER